jgi:hypothetical protein
MKIANVNLKYDKEFGSYFGTTIAEPYDVGKNHFKPLYRFIFVSSNMYPDTNKDFIYITSNITGQMRLYRCRNWFETEIGNIFASGKTLKEAVDKFEYKFKNKIYNKN